MLEPINYKRGDVISYFDMCLEENVKTLQRGMNYRLNKKYSVLLQSTRTDAKYEDEVLEDGNILIYEGHDVSKNKTNKKPKQLDQQLFNRNGTLTQNGLFFNAAHEFKAGFKSAEAVRVYDKLQSGIWTFAGVFYLTDAYYLATQIRKVFKFKLEIADMENQVLPKENKPSPGRIIPTDVKIIVWERDNGRCVQCKSDENLHFDHIIPFSKGGSSQTPDNVQLLCAEHNLKKSDKLI